MSTELILAWVAILIAIGGVGVSVWAVFDVRGQVTRLIQLERKRVFTQIRNDMVWMFVNPTQQSHTPEIAKGLEQFALVSMELNPQHTPDLTNNAVNNESLRFADDLVNNEFAVWKPGWDRAKVKQALEDWQKAINANRLRNILGEEQAKKTLF